MDKSSIEYIADMQRRIDALESAIGNIALMVKAKEKREVMFYYPEGMDRITISMVNRISSFIEKAKGWTGADDGTEKAKAEAAHDLGNQALSTDILLREDNGETLRGGGVRRKRPDFQYNDKRDKDEKED